MIKGVIFDLDGVLVSTDELHYMAWKRLAEELGIHNFTREDNLLQRGVSRMASLEVVLRKADQTYSDEEKTELAERKNNYYRDMLQDLSPADVLPGSLDTLKQLRSRGILTALGSASKNAPLILEKTGLMEWVDQICCGLDVTKSKPDPEVFLVAAKKLDLDPAVCLVVEDAKAGIDAATSGGMKSLAVGPDHENIGGTYRAENLAAPIDWDAVLA